MITIIQGDILRTGAEALVIPVNTAGVMGAGLALAAKKAFPDNYARYKDACAKGLVQTGQMYITRHTRPAWLINFPTKMDWRKPSRLEWIAMGLEDLVKIIASHKEITSVAIPALGCGLGGLRWMDVRPAMIKALKPLKDVEITIYEPDPRT